MHIAFASAFKVHPYSVNYGTIQSFDVRYVPSNPLFAAGTRYRWCRSFNSKSFRMVSGDVVNSSDQLGKTLGSSSTVAKIRTWKNRLEFGMFSIFLAATLSLDFHFYSARPLDFLFVVTSFLYFSFLNFTFRRRGSQSDSSLLQTTEENDSSLLRMRPFTALMGVISIAIPWTLILLNERRNVAILAPHLYLISFQNLIEFGGKRLRWVTPVSVLVPLAFTLVRLPALLEWCANVCSNGGSTIAGISFGRLDRLLAFANLLIWAGHFFIVHIPRTLKSYFHPRFRQDLSREELEAEAALLLKAAARLPQREKGVAEGGA